jgi:hypothetical protein
MHIVSQGDPCTDTITPKSYSKKQARKERSIRLSISKQTSTFGALEEWLSPTIKMLFISPVVFLLSVHLALAFGYVVRDLFVAVYSNPDILTNESP